MSADGKGVVTVKGQLLGEGSVNQGEVVSADEDVVEANVNQGEGVMSTDCEGVVSTDSWRCER